MRRPREANLLLAIVAGAIGALAITAWRPGLPLHDNAGEIAFTLEWAALAVAAYWVAALRR